MLLGVPSRLLAATPNNAAAAAAATTTATPNADDDDDTTSPNSVLAKIKPKADVTADAKVDVKADVTDGDTAAAACAPGDALLPPLSSEVRSLALA